MTKMTTPIGSVKFPNITQPNDKGKYSFALTLDPQKKGVQLFLDDLNKAVAESAYPNYEKVTKQDKAKNDDGVLEPTGNILLNFTSNYPITLYDAKKQRIEGDVDIGWGSQVRVAFTLREFNVDGNKGLCKYARAVQVIELQNGVSADSCGFEEEEGYSTQEKDVWDE